MNSGTPKFQKGESVWVICSGALPVAGTVSEPSAANGLVRVKTEETTRLYSPVLVFKDESAALIRNYEQCSATIEKLYEQQQILAGRLARLKGNDDR